MTMNPRMPVRTSERVKRAIETDLLSVRDVVMIVAGALTSELLRLIGS